MSLTAATRVVAVVGHPVHHSLSPAIHNAAFASGDLDWVMIALPVAPDDGGMVVQSMKVLGLSGVAVTMPHKQAVAATVDEIDPAARALESVNTVVRRSDDSTFGLSTDGAGFVASLVAAGVELAATRVVVLGAGAAARSVIDALGRSGPTDIVVVNRDGARAAAAAMLAPMGRTGERHEVGGADLVVNATSVGMGTTDLPVDPSLLRRDQVVADLVYHPLETALLVAAGERGATTVDGLGMLIHQAALQQVAWTGVEPDVTAMRAAATTELARRHR